MLDSLSSIDLSELEVSLFSLREGLRKKLRAKRLVSPGVHDKCKHIKAMLALKPYVPRIDKRYLLDLIHPPVDICSLFC